MVYMDIISNIFKEKKLKLTPQRIAVYKYLKLTKEHPSAETIYKALQPQYPTMSLATVYKALKTFKSEGIMGDLDDGPDQTPLENKVVQDAILDLLPPKHFDLIITHNPNGEYTKHLRHEEIGRAVITLWQMRKISTYELRTFAYEDGDKEYYPIPIESASICRELTNRIWLRKYNLITETYGFEKDSFEAKTTPKAEAFWQFTDSFVAKKWLNQNVIL